MNIIASAEMNKGTFEAKFVPLAQIEEVDNIFIVRKSKGPKLSKVIYIIIPKIFQISILKLFIPLFLAYHSKLKKASLILSYHAIPHAFYAFIASKLTGIPYNVSQTGLYIQKYSNRKILGKFIIYIFSKAAFINVPGTSSKNFWVNKGIKSQKINVLHSTMDTFYYKPEKMTKEYDFIVLSRLAEVKNIELTIKAIEILVNKGLKIKLVVVGDGGKKTDLEKLADEKNLTDYIKFVGFKLDTNKWFNKAKIYLMSSKSEGLPTSLMQAMSCQLVCITTDVGNISDMITHTENGFLYKSEDLDKLVELMEYALSNYDNLKELRNKARTRIIEEHSYQAAINKWKKVIKKLKS